jgi:hypothetical protein
MYLQCHSASAHRRQDDKDPDWRQLLPADWRAAAIAPLTFAIHREYEIPASRTLGYDEEEKACYYHHAFLLRAPCSDDDEEFYETIVYGEEVHAWRLRDERWLIWRIVRAEGDCRGNRGFYSFSENMPR